MHNFQPSYNKAFSIFQLINHSNLDNRLIIVNPIMLCLLLQGKLRNTKDKKEFIVRERNLLNERLGKHSKNI